MRAPVLSIVIPVYNEEGSIARVIADHVAVLEKILPQGDWEIICLNDASTDNSLNVLEALMQKIPQLSIICHQTNKGIYESFQHLFKEAKGDYIYATGGDGQWPAENCEYLWAHLQKTSADLVVGVRNNRNEVYSLWRRMLSYGFNAIPRLLFNVRLEDANGIKLGRRSIFQESLMSHSFFGEVERIIRARDKGLVIDFAPIVFVSRSTGKAKGAKWGNVFSTIRDMVAYFFTRKTQRSLFFAVLLFIAFLEIGLRFASHKPLWNDEFFSLLSSTVGSSYQRILLGGIGEGNNSPLFYVLQKMQCDVFLYQPPHEWANGNWWVVKDPFSQAFLRVQSVGSIAFALSALFYFFTVNYSIVAGVYSLAIALSSFMLWDHWFEARPYALWFSLSILQMLCLMNILKANREHSADQWRNLTLIHLLLSLTAVLSIIQIFVGAVTLWVFQQRRWRAYIGMLLVPVMACLYYHFIGPHYAFFFKEGPLDLITANISKDRFALLLSCVLIFLLNGWKNKDWGRSLEGKYLFFMGLMFTMFALVMVQLKLTIGNTPNEGFQVSNRYFLPLTVVGIIGTTLISIWLTNCSKVKWVQMGIIIILAVFLMIRIHRIVPFIHVSL